jgi:phosphoglycerate dehydrogenase-like enzyme
MKPGAYLLNLARAALVDDEALYTALRDGHLAGAALDVFADEPVRPDNRYVQLPNVLVSPHLGGATRDVVQHQTDLIVDGIEAWLRGEPPQYLANPAVLSR